MALSGRLAAMQLVLAPLMGITGPEFRRVYHRHFPWFDRALAPFISVTNGITRSNLRFREVFPGENHQSMPLEPQILGKEGHLFAQTAGKLRDEYGYARVNWNIGCPSATVTSRQRGSGILPHPDLIRNFLDQAFALAGTGITIKTRLGLESVQEWESVREVISGYPLEELTIHPRTGRQQYEGLADRKAFVTARRGFSCPVLYNGDINTPQDASEIISACPDLAGLMLGRGAIMDPWLPGRIRGLSLPLPGSPAFFQGLREFHADLAQEYLASRCGSVKNYNPGLMFARMKELWHYWAFHFLETPATPGLLASDQVPSPVRAILKAHNPDDILRAADEAFDLAVARTSLKQ